MKKPRPFMLWTTKIKDPFYREPAPRAEGHSFVWKGFTVRSSNINAAMTPTKATGSWVPR